MKPSTALLGLAAVANAQQESNGVLKAIQIQPDLTKFFAAVQMLPDLAQVLNTASNITIFAPTDKAFEEVLKADPNSNGLILSTLGEAAAVNLLSYHVVQGQFPSAAIPKTPAYVQTLYMSDDHENLVTGGQYVGVVNNGTGVQVLSGELSVSGVVFADIINGGSVSIHTIDKVLTLPTNLTTTLPKAGLTTALGAVAQFPDLASTLSTVPDLTFFVPNNAAFSAVGSVLLSADAATIQSVLEYHAVTGAVVFSDDVTNTTVTSVQGAELTLSVTGKSVFVNGAKVVLPNVQVANGVVHVIDSILNPADAPFDRTALNPSAAPTVAFEGASSAELPFATAVPKPTSTLSVPAVLGGSQATATMATTNTGNAASTTGSGPVASVTAAGGAPGNGLFRGRRGVLGLAVVGGLLAELA